MYLEDVVTQSIPTIHELPVAVIGAGPAGLAAAANLAVRGQRFVVLEAGPSAGHAVRQWGHVQLFSPWRWCIDPAARGLLESTGWRAPDEESLPLGRDIVEAYLRPLAAHPAIAPHLRFDARVARIGRLGIDKVRGADRQLHPFELRLRDSSRLLTRAVIDASGTWFTPNPAGANGLAAHGEGESAAHVSYGIPDVLGRDPERFAGKRVLVVGGGHSAINVALNLLKLRQGKPETAVMWALRRPNLDRLYGGELADALPARGALGSRARRAVESGDIEVLAPFAVEQMRAEAPRVIVEGQLGQMPYRLTVDEVVVATGFRPDLEMLRELRLSLDPGLESSAALGPLIDPNVHSCGTVPPHGYRELAHPEPGFFVIGMKSYGRAPTFLMATGYEQARSVAAHLAGDDVAASRVELMLPETGVCGGVSDGTSCCSTATNDAACCGGPASSTSACCVLDEEAKAAGLEGCGCGSEHPAGPGERSFISIGSL
jgi:thioredoxin reductase